MAEGNGLHIKNVAPLIRLPSPTMDAGKHRMAALVSPVDADYLPLVFGVDIPEQKTFPTFDRRELFYDMDKMACEQAWGALGTLRSGSDGQPTIRVNTGAATVCSIFGLDQEILTDTPPWLQRHLAKDQIKKFEVPEDVSRLGLMPYIREIYEFYRKHLPGVPTYIADTQGPFDLAHLIYGDAIFYDVHDDPGFVRHLCELATQAYIRTTEYMKQITGETRDQAYHSCFFMAAGGVRCCEDTSTLLSPDSIDEFVRPYTNRALDHFGGGFIHYCGKNDHLMDVILNEMPNCRYFNLGNPEKHDFIDVLRRVKKTGKVYVGGPSRIKGQALETYFQMVLTALDGERRGLILMPDLTAEERGQPAMVMDLWRRLQDRLMK